LILFPYFLLFFFNHDFIIYIDFTHITASNTAADDFTKIGQTHSYLMQTYCVLIL